MRERLIEALVQSANEAADDLLLRALDAGNEPERLAALEALIRRQTTHGLGGVVGRWTQLQPPERQLALANLGAFHQALRECGRSADHGLRLAAMELISLGRQGRLAYVLSENLHSTEETLAQAAAMALLDLARWAAEQTRDLQRGEGSGVRDEGEDSRQLAYELLVSQRPEIEQAVARAMDVHRGRQGADLLRAALLLCDWSGSRTLAILHTAKHGGQSPMVRRLQQPPDEEGVAAFLLGASHGGLRSHFGSIFSHIDMAPVLDQLLERTHWLKDHQLQHCVHQVNRGIWWEERDLLHDIERRQPADAARIGEWLAASGMHDVVQDERLGRLAQHAAGDFPARLRLLRIAMRRPRGASVDLLRTMLADGDERLVRMAARELVRRRPGDLETTLLQLMTRAGESVRRVISRAIGQVGFDHFWSRYDRLDRSVRTLAGRAMMKLLPDALQRLARRLGNGPLEQRLKAMQIAHELGAIEPLQGQILQLCGDPNPRLRSKAVSLLGQLPATPAEVLLERALHDSDPRVRANAVEVLEGQQRSDYVPMLTARARARESDNRERANAIKALHGLKVGVAAGQLLGMLKDDRAEHRISALWALRQIGWWQMLREVGVLARTDPNMRVRRYALAVLRGVAQRMEQAQGRTGA